MINTEALREKISSREYVKGRAYFRNARIASFDASFLVDGTVSVKSVIKTSSDHNVELSVDIETGDILSKKCHCYEASYETCRHMAASLIYLIENIDDIMAKARYKNLPEKSVLRQLGLRADFFKQTSDTAEISFTFKAFNIGIDEADTGILDESLLARDLRFCVTVNDHTLGDTGIIIDRNLIKRSKGQSTLFLDYVSCNGTYIQGDYYIGQYNIDTALSIASGLDSVYWSDPPRKVEISNELYMPKVRAAASADGSMLLSEQDDLTLIPGKYSIFVLVDDKIMRLSSRVPYTFMKKMKKRMLFDPAKSFILKSLVLPSLGKVVELENDENTTWEQPPDGEITPEISIYLVFDKETEIIYLLAQIDYAGHYIVNPFTPEHLDEFKNFYQAYPGMRSLVQINKSKGNFFFKRDVKLEFGVYSFFAKWIKDSQNIEGRLIIGNSADVYTLFYEILPRIPEEWHVYYDKEIEKLRPVKADVDCDFDFETDINNGLLDFNVYFHFKNMKIDQDQLLEYIENNRRLLFIDGRFVEIMNKHQLKKLFMLLDDFEKTADNNRYTAKLNNIGSLSEHIDTERLKKEEMDKRLLDLISEAKEGRVLKDVDMPAVFENVLRPYQKDGVRWLDFLQKYQFGGILADDMGLGKTLQALVVINMSSKDRPSLVVCPKTLVFNWLDEAAKFVPEMTTHMVQGGREQRHSLIRKIPKGGLVITSYNSLQRDITLYGSMEFEYCIIDEAQNIKNPDTNNAICVKSINARNKLALTGTPVENSLTDLWSIFDFAMPGFLGTEDSFTRKYVDDAQNIGRLHSRIKPFLLRRTKTQMLKELPPKIEQVQYAGLSKAQLTLYKKMLEDIRGKMQDATSRIEILAGLTRLRQICNHPGLVNEKLLGHPEISGKMELLKELIDECVQGGHRVLLFSQFVKMLDIIQAYLEDKGIGFVRLDGKTKDRKAVIEEFANKEELPVFLISLKAGGVGLNLTSADTVIIYDPWWNPMAEEQAMDRAHRIGQTKTVNVYRLITRETIEEKIQKLQRRKKDLFESVIDETGEEHLDKLTWDDIRELLS